MEIEYTPLWDQALEIFYNKDKPPYYGWSATIHIDNEKQETLEPFQITAVNIRRDYILAYADEITCTLVFPMGQYARRIYPNRNKLQISLSKHPLKNNSAELDYTREIESERYTATLIDDGRALTELQGAETNDEEALNIIGFKDVNFQLFNKAVEQIRLITVGGVFRKTNVCDVIQSVLTKESKSIKVDTKQALKGVDIIDTNNKDTKEQIVITHGIKLYDLPNYIQNKYGVYSSGLGSYIQNSIWYIFSLYDTTEYNKREKNLTLLIIPKKKIPEVELSFLKIGDNLNIVVTGETGFKDDSGSQYLNDGNGNRFGDANKFLDGYSSTEGNKTIISRTKNNSEFIVEKRENNQNHVQMTNSRISANPYTAYSNILSRRGGYFKGVWENSDPSLIFPGMLVKMIYFDKTDIHEVFGVLLGTENMSVKAGDSGSRKHTTNSLLHVFVNK